MNPVLKRMFPNASQSTLAANADGPEFHLEIEGQGSDRGKTSASSPKLERTVGHGTLGEGQAKEGDSGRYFVRVTSVRKRLIDEDNLSAKYVVDFMRYCGAIPSDAPGKTSIQTTQRKAGKEEAEHTLIEIYAVD